MTEATMFKREDLEFDSHGTRCQGYLYRPLNASAPVPCVIMAHGFGATRECGLTPYAEAFARAGYAVFLFDYRHFGASGGEARQVLLPWREVADWLAAIAFVRGIDGVRADAIALWGTSFAGGLATIAAARDGHVQALIAQCPLMDGVGAVTAALRYAGAGHVLKLTAHATLDIARAIVGMSPHYISSAGRPGEMAAMTSSDSHDGYMALAPDGVRTDVAARVIPTLLAHRPIRRAHEVRCPALIQICEKDTVAPVAAAEEAAASMPRAEVRRYALGHFDIYQGAAREKSIGDQLAFLRRHMPTTVTSTSATA